MNPLMLNKVDTLIEGFSTFLTGVGFLAGVNPLMLS